MHDPQVVIRHVVDMPHHDQPEAENPDQKSWRIWKVTLYGLVVVVVAMALVAFVDLRESSAGNTNLQLTEQIPVCDTADQARRLFLDWDGSTEATSNLWQLMNIINQERGEMVCAVADVHIIGHVVLGKLGGNFELMELQVDFLAQPEFGFFRQYEEPLKQYTFSPAIGVDV